MGTRSTESTDTYPDLLRVPDLVRAFGADGEIALHLSADGVWAGSGVVVGFLVQPDRLAVKLRAEVPPARLQLRWHAELDAGTRYLGDHWERSYGDLEWRGESPDRVMPWYFLAHGAGGTHGYGVRVGPRALCFWTADRAGISLWADVRSGGVPVQLGERVLDVCDVVCRRGHPDERPFAAHQAFCRVMCPSPRLPDHQVYGTNDWYVAHGRNSRDLIRRTSEQLSELARDAAGQPYSVIDDGWSQGGLGTGPWFGNDRFGDMGSMAVQLNDLGVRPGIWYRPLTPWPEVGDTWRMPHNGCLDPTVPEVHELVAGQLRRMVGWGYRLIKHDFSSWDVFGRWGFGMGASITDDGWAFADRSRTTAEVLLGLYRTVREASGDAVLIGCNTVGHLAAGLVELQRIGDDVSSSSFGRTRRMGVNALAFRAAQHGTFFAVDADVAPVGSSLPWRGAREWLQLVAASGTPLFVSVDPDVRDPAVLAEVRDAITVAASARAVAEPLDWTDTVWPARWLLAGREQTFDWMDPTGGKPFGD
jgi:alpha-galactosidase